MNEKRLFLLQEINFLRFCLFLRAYGTFSIYWPDKLFSDATGPG